MKFELNDNAANTLVVVALAAMAVAIAFFVYRYNATAFEQGYTQRQLENSQMTMWVKQ